MNIAIIGASADRSKFGNKCVRAYRSKGFSVFPVNPKEKEIEGLKCYSRITEIHESLDIVSLYLPPDKIHMVASDILAKKPRIVYFNPGTENEELAKKFRDAGIDVREECSIRALGLSPASF